MTEDPAARPAPWERRTLLPPGPPGYETEPIFRMHDLHAETELIRRIPADAHYDWDYRYPDDDGYDEQPAQAGDEKKENSRLLASTGSIAIATLTSRITGFLKQTLLVAVLGGLVSSSYYVASQVPNMVSELVLSAVLTAIVVPVLVRAEREDADGGEAFVRKLFTAAFTVLAVATLLAVASAPLIAKVVLAGDSKVDPALTTALLFLLLPAIVFYGMSALLMALLNTRQVFKPGAWAPVLNNLVVLVVLGVFYLTPGEISLNPVRLTDPKLLVLGVGLTLGVVMQVACLVPAIRRNNIDLRPLWGIDARLKRFAGMGVAIVLYVLISQLGMVFATRISSGHDPSGPTIYNNAWALLQLPYGVLGVTVLTAIMPRLSRHASTDDTPAVVDDLSVATRLTMIALIPVVTFMTLSGKQIGETLFGHGKFSFYDAGRLGEAVAWSAFTLIPYALVLIHLRVFYAREQAWTPTWIILGITGVKIAFSALAPVVASNENQVVILLGVATGLGFIAGALIGGFLLHRSLGNLRTANIGRTVWRVILASMAGGVVMLIVDRALRLQHLTNSLGWMGSGLRVGFGGILMLTVTFTIMRVAGIPEIVGVTVAISRRLGLSSSSSGLPPSETVEYATTRRPYDPLMDAETMILPVIRADAFDTTGAGEFPYPVRQRDTGSMASARAHEGARVSDDAVTGLPTSRRSAETGATGTTDVSAPHEDRLEHVVAPQEPGLDQGRAGPPSAPIQRITRGPQLIPGASVAGGRYRLLASHGGARGLVFWQALDIKLDREVALTFVDADQRGAANLGEDGPQAILSRTLRLGRISSPGLARVLDVVRGSSGGIVVAEWTPGRSLREMAETRPSPIGAARAIAALAGAAELTHRGGGALSIDHPDRVRISVAGDAVLAFPGTLADADVPSDVRGIGAMLYALMLARWPIGAPNNAITGTAAPSSTIGGLRPADHTAAGTPVEPRAVRPEVPFEISAVAVRSLDPNQGVRTAATLQHVLEQASVVDQKTEMLPSLRVGQRAPNAADMLSDPDAMAAEQARSRRMMIILAGLGALIVLILGLIGWWLANFLTGGGDGTPLSSAPLGLTTSAVADPSQSNDVGTIVGGVPVPPSTITVFSPQGTPDDPGSARNVLTNGAGSVWRTDTYHDQFGTANALKSGVGLLATLPAPAKLTSVLIESPSVGTQVEVRTSPTDYPTLDQTQVVGRTVLTERTTKIQVKSDQPVRYVLIWITKLAHTNSGQYQSSLADVSFTAAA